MEYTGERMIPEKNEGGMMWAEHYARYIFSSSFVKGKVVLDIACGSGYGALYLAERDARKVFGIDNSEEAIKYAKQTFPHPKVKYSVGDAQDMKLPSESIDVVVSFETIEHLPDCKKFLSEVQRVLRRGGLLIISTPNKAVFPPGAPFHTKEFMLEEFRATLKKLFKHVEFFYQDNWVTTGVLRPKSTGFANLYKEFVVRAFKIFGKDYKKSLYFLAICSDKPIPKKDVETLTLYSFALTVDDWLAKRRVVEERLKNNVSSLRNELTGTKNELTGTKNELTRIRNELDRIYRSRSWRLVTMLRKIKGRLPIVRKL